VRLLFVCALLLVWPTAACAQFHPEAPGKGPRIDRATTQRIRVGVTIKATGGTVQRIVATAPVPADWPEQAVKIVDEDISPSYAKVEYRTIAGGGGVKQLVLEIPRLAANQEARALVTFEVTRYGLAAPADTSIYTIPRKVDRLMSLNLGSSPYIESRHPKIVSAAKEAVGDREGAWDKAEAIYQWVRANVAQVECELKGAARALYDKQGGPDELTSLFVAMCRAQKIPARTVFVLGHCYAEFYLEDDQGQGHWFPCDLAGLPSFGGIENPSPILQKGDNFRNPENPKERLRFVTEYFYAAGRGKAPTVKFVSQLVAE
jgi:transglutaminase-like putative cysteine protease